MKKKNVYIAGHNGMVGSAIKRILSNDNSVNILTKSRNDLDLVNQQEVNAFFSENKIDEVYLAAAKVGGIHANNTYPAEFIYQNLMIESNIIHAAHTNNVDKLLFLGSSCIYPKEASQPMTEEALLSGKLEPTNEPYAIAKIAGIKLCESYNRQYRRDYRSVMPTNLYGPGDNYHPENSHVIPGLIRRFHEAKINNIPEVKVWGSGNVFREFLYVDDMADACVHVMNLDNNTYKKVTEKKLSHINVGSGKEILIRDLVLLIVDIIGYRGRVLWDIDKPDGSRRKLIDSKILNKLGWNYRITLEVGLRETISWFNENKTHSDKIELVEFA